MGQLVESPAAIALRRGLLVSPAADLSLSRDGHALYTRHQHEKSVALHLEQNAMQRNLFIRTGDRIRVPLAGVEGIVIRVKDSMHIVLSVEILCRSVAIDVNEAIVEHMPAES